MDYPWIGRRLQERYLVTGFLGSGAFSQVYRVLSLNIPRTFALKIIDLTFLPKHEHDQFSVRLKREIEALAKLHNPHIVSLSEVLTLGPRTMGLVMDFIEGDSLATILAREGRLNWARALRLTRQIALAMQPLHQLGKVHRDIKPDNLMVSALAPQVEFVHMLDFGFVSDTQRVSTGFIGTPYYASPEMCAGELEVDPRSDIYSLGSVLYHMIAGRPPIEGRTAYEVIFKKATVDAQRLSREIDVPARLDQLVHKMLVRDKSLRHASVDEVIEEVDEILEELNYAKYGNASGTSFLLEQAKPRAPLRDIIIADADQSTAARLSALLADHDLRCRTVDHAQTLLDQCMTRKPELVLLSTDLPDARELKVYKLLRQHTQARVVILVPEHAPARLFQAMEVAGVDFLVKPIERDLLLECLGLRPPQPALRPHPLLRAAR